MLTNASLGTLTLVDAAMCASNHLLCTTTYFISYIWNGSQNNSPCSEKYTQFIDIVSIFIKENRHRINLHESTSLLVDQITRSKKRIDDYLRDLLEQKKNHDESIFRYWRRLDCTYIMNELEYLTNDMHGKFHLLIELLRTFTNLNVDQ